MPRFAIVSLQPSNVTGRYVRHADFRLRVDILGEPPTELERKDATFSVVDGLAQTHLVSFRSWNYSDHYIRHRNFEVFLEQRPPEGDAGRAQFDNDATWIWDPNSRFRALNFPDHYLRHKNYLFYLDKLTSPFWYNWGIDDRRLIADSNLDLVAPLWVELL